MTAKTTTNRNFPIPNQGDFRPPGAGVFEEVVIRSPSPPGQTPAMGTPFICSVISRVAVQTVSLLPPGVHMAAFTPSDQAVIRSAPDLT